MPSFGPRRKSPVPITEKNNKFVHPKRCFYCRSALETGYTPTRQSRGRAVTEHDVLVRTTRNMGAHLEPHAASRSSTSACAQCQGASGRSSSSLTLSMAASMWMTMGLSPAVAHQCERCRDGLRGGAACDFDGNVNGDDGEHGVSVEG